MNRNFVGDLRGEPRLAQLLEAAAGLDAAPSASYPETETSVHVLVDEAIGTKTLQRVALHSRSEGLVLCTWPAELKAQAREFYRADRVARFLGFLAEQDQAWRAARRRSWRSGPRRPASGFNCAVTLTSRST